MWSNWLGLVDPPFVLTKWATDHGIQFTLLSDPFHECTNVFGVEFIGPGRIEHYTSANRAVFIID